MNKKDYKKAIRMIAKKMYQHQYTVMAIAAMMFIAVSVVAIVGLTPTNAGNEAEMFQTCDQLGIEHDMIVDFTAPSCSGEGHYHIQCAKCSYVDTTTTIEPTGHEYRKTTDPETGKDVVYCEKCNQVVHVN